MNEMIIAPSILGADHSNVAGGVEFMVASGIKWAHVDVMDGHFVPNLSFGPGIVSALKPKFPQLFYDVHLMLDNPHLYIDAFAKAGADMITIHVEPDYPVDATLQEIHLLGCKAGVTLNPATPIDSVLPFLNKIDMVLVMSVQPGFGGQSFKPEALEKISTLAKWREEMKLNFRIEVDGGITANNVRDCITRGADTIVAGTEFFKNTSSLLASIFGE